MALLLYPDGNVTGNESELAINEKSINLSDIFSFQQPLDIPYIRWIYITLFGIIFLCCVLGNATVIYVILRHKKMRNITNFFLANLAFSDLCVGIFCVLPNLMTFLFPFWMLGRILCKLYYFIQCTSYTASVLILTVISLERYFAIIHPMFNKRVTRMCLLRVVVVIIWLCAALYGTPNLIAYDLYRVRTGNNNKTLDFCVTTGHWNIDMEVYSILNFIVLYLLPLLLIVVMYVRISNALWRSGNNMTLNASSCQRNSELQQKRTCLRCPQCKQIVYNETTLAKGNAFGGKANKGRTPGNEEQHTLVDNGRSKRSPASTGHVTNVNQWARSVEEASDDEILPPRHCQCNTSVNLVVKKPLVTSTNKRKTCRKASNPLTTRRKVIRLLIFIILSFAICVLPHHIRLLWQYWLTPTASFSFVHMLVPPSTFLFFYANSALNPFLYAFLSEQFRRAFVDLLPSQWRCGKISRSPGQRARHKMRGRGSMSETQLQDVTSHTVCRLTTSGVDTNTVTECL